MPKAKLEQQPKPEVSAELAAHLKAKLALFVANKHHIDQLSREQERVKEELEIAFADYDEYDLLRAGVRVHDLNVKLVEGVSTKLDKKKLLEQGVTMAQIEAATTTKPKKAYVDIRLPGQRTRDDGDE